MGDDLTKSEPELGPSATKVEADALETAPGDPLVAAVALQWVSTKYFETATVAFLPADVERTKRAIRLTRECVAAFDGKTPLPSSAEMKWRDHALRRAALAEASVYERAAELSPELADWRSNLMKALEARRTAFTISAKGAVLLGNLKNKDGRRVIELLLVLGELRLDEPALDVCPPATREFLAMDAGRIAHPDHALELALALTPPSPDAESLAARACADLGRFDEARAHAAQVLAFEQKGVVSFYDHFSAVRTKGYVEQKAHGR